MLRCTIRAPHPQNRAGKPGLYRFYLAHSWSTTLLDDGPYRLEVEATDRRGNNGSLRLPSRSPPDEMGIEHTGRDNGARRTYALLCRRRAAAFFGGDLPALVGHSEREAPAGRR